MYKNMVNMIMLFMDIYWIPNQKKLNKLVFNQFF
jgi:hypothetical protein